MLDVIDLVKANSERYNNIDAEPMFELAEPVLLRKASYGAHVQIQIPLLILTLPVATTTEVVEDVKVLEVEQVIINTMEPEAPAIAFCEKTHEKCGHACKGVTKERKCLPCLDTACAEASGHFEGTNEDELCNICYTSELGSEACSQLSCGHVFHTNCVVQLLKHRWTTLRISFAFMSCPKCKQEIELKKGISQPIAAELGPLSYLK